MKNWFNEAMNQNNPLGNSTPIPPPTPPFKGWGWVKYCTGLYGNQSMKALAAGIVLYVLYVISIGGDFISGRYLTSPLLLAAIIIALIKFSVIQLKAFLICTD